MSLPAPFNRVPEETKDPSQETRQVLQGHQIPLLGGQRVIQYLTGHHPRHHSPEGDCKCGQRPPARLQGHCQKRQGQRIGKDLAQIPQRPRPPGTACPPKPVAQIFPETLAADAMLNHIRGKKHAPASLRHQLTHHEIFGKIVLERGQATDELQGVPTNGKRTSQSEVHSVQETRDEHAAQKLGVHSNRFHARPQGHSGHGPVRTGHERHRAVVHLSRNDPSHLRGHADVAIGHQQNVMSCIQHHLLEREYLAVGPGRIPCNH
jgi:hypothetical protein